MNNKFGKTSITLSSLMLAIGLSLTACSKHEAAEGHKTEDIAAEQGELAKKANPETTASQPASFKATAPAAASSNTATATASNTASTTTVTTTTTTTTTETASAPATTAATASDSAAGETLYNATCKTCHEPGLAGAPKVGDKAAWKDRIAQGNDTLHKHAIEGYQGKAGMMPAKGGNAAASNDDVKAAVDYMVAKSK